MGIELDNTHCTCNNISYKEIQYIVDRHKDIKDIKDLQWYCACANKCSSCKTDIQKIIDFFRL